MHSAFRKFRRSGFLLISLVLMGAFSWPADAQDNDATRTVDVIGSGAIRGNDMASAREQAILNALVSAVAAVTAELQPLGQQVDGFNQFNELLYNQTSQYIKDYKVLTEYMSGKDYRAIVQATVMKEKVRETLMSGGLLAQPHAMPNVLFFVAEKKMDHVLPVFWWGEDLVFTVPSSEEAMAQVFRENGMTVIGHSSFVDPLNYPLSISSQDAIELGKHVAADIVIIARAAAEKTTNVMDGNVKSFKGSISAKAYRTETGREMASAARVAVAASGDVSAGENEALFNAGLLLGQELLLQLTSAWESESSRQSLVEIDVRGTSELANFIEFRQALGKIPGVKAIHIRVMKADESTITVDFEGSSQALADELLLQTFESFGIDIYEVSPGHLGIELVTG